MGQTMLKRLRASSEKREGITARGSTLAVCALVGWLLSLEVLRPSIASACSCATDALVRAWPAHGAIDVPLDVALVVAGMLDPSALLLVDEEEQAVHFETSAAPWTEHCLEYVLAEVKPVAPLLPERRYQLRVYGPAAIGAPPGTLGFTTGRRMLGSAQPAAPRANASVLTGFPDGGGCGAPIQACIGIEDPGGIELTVLRDGSIVTRDLVDLAAPFVGLRRTIPDCIEFRRRLSNGLRSEPRRICGGDLSIGEWRASDYIGLELYCENGRFDSRPIVLPREEVGAAGAAALPAAGHAGAGDGGAHSAARRGRQSCAVGAAGRDRHSRSWLATLPLVVLLTRRVRHQCAQRKSSARALI